MKYFLAVLLTLFFAVSAFSQAIGTAMRTTNGIALGTTTIGGNFQSTNRVSTNRIHGKLFIGDTNLPVVGSETLLISKSVTNPSPSGVYFSPTYFRSKFAFTSNIFSLNAGVSSVVNVGAANTSDWTNSQYPQLMGFNASVQPEAGSSGIVRRAAAYSGTMAGAATEGNGAIIDEGVVFWGDTANGSGNSLSNIVGFKMSGLNAGWNNTGLWLGIEQETYPLAGNWGITDTTDYPSYFAGNVSIGETNTTNTLNIGAGTLPTQSKAINVTATLANSSVTEIGGALTITGAGSGANAVRAFATTLSSGYSGSGSSAASAFGNSSAGTGTGGWIGGSANYGSDSTSSGLGSGHNIGVIARGQQSSSLNIGVFGRAVFANNSALLNVGVAGHALNASTANIGGFFGLMNAAPTLTESSALMADNGATTDNILIWRDNGTIVGGIADGGVIHGDGSGLTNLPSSSSLWFTNPAAASSISNTYNVKTTGSIQSTNTTTANTALTLNGAATGANGIVAGYDTNGVNKWKFDSDGDGTLAGTLTVSGGITGNTTIVAGTSLTAFGLLSVGADATITGKLTTSAVLLRTNTFPVSPNFVTGVQRFSTNASFKFLQPVGVDTTKTTFQVTEIFVDNTLGSPIQVTPPDNVDGVCLPWVITNRSKFKFEVYGGDKFTNAYHMPIK